MSTAPHLSSTFRARAVAIAARSRTPLHAAVVVTASWFELVVVLVGCIGVVFGLEAMIWR